MYNLSNHSEKLKTVFFLSERAESVVFPSFPHILPFVCISSVSFQMASSPSCGNCDANAHFQCSCEVQTYCSKSCQSADWESHKGDHRNHFLRGRPRVRMLTGHEGKVTSGLCSLGKGLFVSASDDRTIRIWQKDTGDCVKTLLGHTSWIFDVCSLGKDTIASGSSDETVRIWNVDTGDCRELRGHTNWVLSVCALLPSGCGLLASASNDRTVRVWNVDRSECVLKLEHDDWVEQVCAYADNRIACASGSAVHLWNTESGERIKALEGHEDYVASVCVFGEGRLASGSRDKTIRIWDVETGECLRKLDRHSSTVHSLRASGDFLASASVEEVRVWRKDSSECVVALVVDADKHLNAICWLGSYTLAMTVDSAIKLLDFETPYPMRRLESM